jgi:hypothetical protein
MRTDDGPEYADPQIAAALEAFARHGAAGSDALPWAERLSPADRERLRGDLAVVLGEPDQTGEPLDWSEIAEILQEWAEVAGWDEVLVRTTAAAAEGNFSVHLRPRDNDALSVASAAVQTAMEMVLSDFLPRSPTAWHLLPRGRLKKMRERDTWQLQLPDGYRLRYVVDKSAKEVHVVYLGPHPDRDPRGREQHIHVKLRRRRYEDE